MSEEYIKKLSQIKKDIGVVQDSIFFELHKLNEINKSLESRIKELEGELKAEQALVNNCLHHDLSHFFMEAIKKRIKERKELEA